LQPKYLAAIVGKTVSTNARNLPERISAAEVLICFTVRPL
jgi:hypothetical protein